MDELARDLWRHHKVILPDLLARLTPHQFVALFAHSGAGGFDRVRALQLSNDERGQRGERPIIPGWL